MAINNHTTASSSPLARSGVSKARHAANQCLKN
jgi:hypothetical protein